MGLTQADLIKLFKEEIAQELSITVDEISVHETFLSIGLDSITAIFLLERLEKKLQIELNPIWFWDYPTINSFTQFLTSELSRKIK